MVDTGSTIGNRGCSRGRSVPMRTAKTVPSSVAVSELYHCLYKILEIDASASPIYIDPIEKSTVPSGAVNSDHFLLQL